MGMFTYKDSNNDVFNSSTHLKKLHSDKDFDKLKTLLETLSVKHGLSPKDLAKAADKDKELSIPISIFSTKKLSMLEASVKYLKEDYNLKYSKIGKILNRNDRTIWATYANSQKKYPKKLAAKEGIQIPINILSNRNYSILEAAVGYLKEELGLRFSQIAKKLNRDDRTVWTCYSRLIKKKEGGNEAR